MRACALKLKPRGSHLVSDISLLSNSLYRLVPGHRPWPWAPPQLAGTEHFISRNSQKLDTTAAGRLACQSILRDWDWSTAYPRVVLVEF